MNKRKMKKAYRKIWDGKALTGNENAAIYNGHGDFTKKLVKQLDLGFTSLETKELAECDCGECSECVEEKESAKDREHDEMCALGYK